jgi:hypothetical protein
MRLVRIPRCSLNGVAVDTCLFLNKLGAIPVCMLWQWIESFEVLRILFLMRKVKPFFHSHTA